MLEVTEFAGGLTMIAKRRTSRLDRLIEHVVNGSDQSFGAFRRRARFRGERCGETARRKPREKQRLAHLDVAEPRDHALIEQRGLQASLLVTA